MYIVACLLAAACAIAQPPARQADPASPGPATSAAPQTTPADPQDAPGAHGTVLFSRDLASPSSPPDKSSADALPALSPGDPDPLHITDAERSAETFTGYALDVHLRPVDHAIAAQAELHIRNDGSVPVTRVVLQVSSSLAWEEVALRRKDGSLERLPTTVRRLATDADHTGWAAELIANLPEPLAPGGAVQLRASYSGTIAASAERLERIGAPPADAAAADWDAIDPPGPDSPGTSVALRGFADVLWYPVSTPAVFLGDGAKLFEEAGKLRLRDEATAMKLRLTVEFSGDAPDAVFFCGRSGSFRVVHDSPDLPIALGTGVATADFPEAPLGFRVPSLFVTDHPATSAGTETDPDLIAVVTEQFPALKVFSAAATDVEPLLTAWFGPHPLGPLHLLDHPGQPFEDDAVLVRSIGLATSSSVTVPLVHSLTHAWFHSDRPWIDEGLAQLMTLLWTERTAGRQTALAELEGSAKIISLAEPAPQTGPGEAGPVPSSAAASASSSSNSVASPETAAEVQADSSPGQPLVRAWSDVFYRTKAGAVWWMLRDLVGDDALRKALSAYRADPSRDRDPAGFEHALEAASHQDLRWFFTDWVYQDRGLPDLSIVNVTPRPIQATGRPDGWLVSVEVRNDGDAVADVPVTVRSAQGAGGGSATSETERLRVPGHSSVTRRIVFPAAPAEVQVNDGGVPETRVSVHTEMLSGSPG